MKEFIHLHLHTQYSLLDGAIKIKDLAKKASQSGFKAVAITDHGNLFGSYEFYKEMKANGLKPLIGMESYFTTGSMKDKKGKGSEDNITDKYNHHLILIAKDDEGFKNLMELSSLAFKEGFYYKPRIDYETLATRSKGLIALTACLKGVPTYYASRDEIEKAKEWIIKFKDIFRDDLYLEIQENDLREQERANINLIELAKKLGVKLIATNDCHYLNKEDKKVHNTLLAIQMKKTLEEIENTSHYGDVYFALPDEMYKKFEGKFDGWERALLNTLEVAEKVSDTISFFEDKSYKFPSFSIDIEPKDYIRELAKNGLKKRFDREEIKIKDENTIKLYEERLNYELDVISKMGFDSYFLIVQDFINYAKQNDIPVGPGRGSAAGSLVAYALGITDVDPIKHGLLFERFLNPERISMPDIDVDFCMDKRDKVIEYVKQKYGEESVAQIITYNTMKARQTLRDVARVMGIPYSEADKIAKLIPQGNVQGTWLSLEEMYITPLEELKEKYVGRPDIEDNVLKFRKLCEENKQIKDLVDIALKLEGLTRHTSLHAAGIVIAPKPIHEIVPLFADKNDVATQFDMVRLEELGLIKMDFLGLKTLTELKAMKDLVKERRGIDIDFLKLDIEDKDVYEFLAQGNTVGVFQLESKGMRELIKRLKPDSFNDIVAALALYRPGPLKSGMVEKYINRKHKRENVEYTFEELEPILKETYGLIVYQEQIMFISNVLAGFTMGEADQLRKAIGKKKADLMAKIKSDFIERSVERGYNKEKVEKLWEEIEEFASYSFNKSHSVAYAYLSFWTAYIKKNFKEEFYTVKLSTENSDKKFINLIKDAKTNGVDILPPSINKSMVDFYIEDKTNKIRFGLSRIKGVGEDTARHIVSVRGSKDFKSFQEFLQKVDSRKVNKKVIEALAKAGAFDEFEEREKFLFKLLIKKSDIAMLSQKSLFGKSSQYPPQLEQISQESQSTALLTTSDTEKQEKIDVLKLEKEVLGFYISSHPLDKYSWLFKGTNISSSNKSRAIIKFDEIEDFEDQDLDLKDRETTLIGVVSDLQIKKTKNGSYMAIFNLIDKTGIIEVVVFPDRFDKISSFIKDDIVVIVKGSLDEDLENESLKVIANEIQNIDSYLKSFDKLIIKLSYEDAKNGKMPKLKEILQNYSSTKSLIEGSGYAPDIILEIDSDKFYCSIQVSYDIKPILSEELLKTITENLNLELSLS